MTVRLVCSLIGIVCVSAMSAGCQSADPAWWPGGRNYGQGAYGSAPLFVEPPTVEYSYPSGPITDTVPTPTIVPRPMD
jgi:hypothetical protein